MTDAEYTFLKEAAKIAGAGLAGSLGAAIFGTYFGLRKFRKEEAWKQKRDAYDAIVFELGRHKANAITTSDYYRSGQMTDDSTIARPKDLKSLEEIAFSEDYIISETAAKALQSFIAETENPNLFPDDWADGVLKHVDKTISIIRNEAARDLKLKFKRAKTG